MREAGASHQQRSMLVTGGARGLGAAIAARAMADGYRVAVIDPCVDGAPEGCVSYPISVTDQNGITMALDDFGTPDVVVNNAGIVRFGPLIEQDSASFREVVEVNLIGTFQCARSVVRRLVAEDRPGVVINITSMNGVAAGPNAGAYGATKAGIALLTSQMAIEWGPLGIRVNAIAPGLIDAGMSEPIYADGEIRRMRESRVPAGRLGTADDIADVALYLASDRAAYIHGQNIVVDGGVTGSVIAGLPRPQRVDGVGVRT